MNEPDFSGVAPTRFGEARRRIQVIEAYLRIEGPSGDDTVGAADQLGLSRWTFMRLVKSWREHRNPAMLVNSQIGPSNRSYGLDDRGKLFAQQAIRETGISAEISNIFPIVEAACREAGFNPPSRPTIYNYIVAERAQGHLRFDQPPSLVIGRMWFHLPIEGRACNEMPCALVAVAMPERFILARDVAVSRETPPSVAKVAEDFCNLYARQGPRRTLVIERMDRIAASRVLASRDHAITGQRSQSPQKILAQAFGDRLGELKPVYRAGSALAKPKYVMGRHDEPLSTSAAAAVIEAAIRSSNKLRQEPDPFSL